jgi:hypothetical protein
LCFSYTGGGVNWLSGNPVPDMLSLLISHLTSSICVRLFLSSTFAHLFLTITSVCFFLLLLHAYALFTPLTVVAAIAATKTATVITAATIDRVVDFIILYVSIQLNYSDIFDVAKLMLQYNNEITTYRFVKLNKLPQGKGRKMYGISSKEFSNCHLECFFLFFSYLLDLFVPHADLT